MLDKIIKILLIVLSVYLVVVLGMFIKFDIDHPTLNGIYVILYLVMFTLAVIGLTIIYNKDISKYLAFSIYMATFLGVNTFYQIFIKYAMTENSGDVLYGFDYYIYHTFFREYEFERFQTPSAISYLVITGIVVISAISLSLMNKTKEQEI